MSVGWYFFVMALIASWLASLDLGEVGRMRFQEDLALVDEETMHTRDAGFGFTSQTMHWEQITALQASIVANRMHQLMDEVSAPAVLSVADLGISGLVALPDYFTMEVNGSGGGSLRVSLPIGADPQSIAQLINLQLGNQFAGHFDGSDIVSDRGYILSLASGLASPEAGEVVVIIQ